MPEAEEPPRPRIVLVLEALPCSVPWPIRLRQLLKTALRRDRLKCIETRELPRED